RADEDQAGSGAGFGELRVLREEAVAGVDRLRAGTPRCRQDRLAAQVTLARRCRTDMDRFVGEAHMARRAIGVRIHRDSRDAEPAAGGDHPAGDLAAVGDQDLVEHARGLLAVHRRKTPKRVAWAGALSAADNPSANTRRVSAGSITPSSHRRALA